MIGRTLGGFRITEQIGMGGMATVFKAYDASADRYVAIKTLPQQYSTDAAFRARFEQEAKAIAKLEHIHILPMFAYGEEDGIAYMVMRYFETGTLKEWLADHRPSLEQVSRLLRQMASALDYAHSQQIIHRDIKPSNILMDRQDNAILTDFGIAKIVENSLELTGTSIVGTPQYMSPEQFKDSAGITPASDQYSLGVVIYEMLTGRPPYQAETPMAILQMQAVGEALPPPRQLRPDLSSDMEQVLLKALARRPEQRFPSCSAMADAFAQAIAVPAPIVDADTLTIDDESTLLVDPTVPASAGQTIRAAASAPKPRSIPLYIPGIGMILTLIIVGAFLAFSGGDDESDNPVAVITDEPVAEATAIESVEPTEEPTILPTETLPPTDSPSETPLPTTTRTTTTRTHTPQPTETPAPTVTPIPTQITRDAAQLTFADDFADTAYDGALNPLKWWVGGATCQAVQGDGRLNLAGNCNLSVGTTYAGDQNLQADLMLPDSPDFAGANSLGVRIQVDVDDGGAVCGLGLWDGIVRAYFYYTPRHGDPADYEEFALANFDQWYNFALQYDAETTTFSCMMDDTSLGSYAPDDTQGELIQMLATDPNAVADNVRANTMPGFGALDAPFPNQQLSGLAEVGGWAILSPAIERVEVTIDGVVVGQTRYGTARPDVAEGYPNVAEAGRSGFNGQIDTRQLEDGEYTLAVWLITTEGQRVLLHPGGIPITIAN